MTPSQIRVAFDSGWTDGDPGDGRVRFDAPNPLRARFIYINACDAQDALLEDIVPMWGLGDVLVVERIGPEQSRIVAWVIGPVRHGGSYWKIPVSVRTVSGSFAAHDEVRVTRYENEAALAPPQPLLPPPPLAPVVPLDLAAAPAGTTSSNASSMSPALTPVAPVAVAGLLADNEALRDLLRELTSDTTPLELVTYAR